MAVRETGNRRVTDDLHEFDRFHVLRHLLIRQQAGREVMELIAVMRHPPLGHFLLKTDGVHNDGDGIIGSALDRAYNMVRKDHRYFVGTKDDFLHVIQCARRAGMTDEQHQIGRDDISVINRETVYIAYHRHFLLFDRTVRLLKNTSCFHKSSFFLDFGDPADFNLWGEEDLRQLYKLRSNAVIDLQIRRQKYCFFLTYTSLFLYFGIAWGQK